jgi:hypothetical protein
MQKIGYQLPTTIKNEIAKLTQTRPTPFQKKVPRTSWWYEFKRKHP